MTHSPSTKSRLLVSLKVNHERRQTPPFRLAANDREEHQGEPLLTRIHYLETQLAIERQASKEQKARIAQAVRAAEAKIKNHLSYRFGQEIVKCRLSPIAWICLPFKLIQAYRNYLSAIQQVSCDALSTTHSGVQASTHSAQPKRALPPAIGLEEQSNPPLKQHSPQGSALALAKRTANAETFTNQTPQRSDPAPTTKRQLARFRALSILDDFSHQCFSSEFELIPAHRENWLDQLENDNIDFFFAESAWRGNGGTWNYSMSKFAGKFGKPLSDLIRACNRKNIPTVFWNKEDPLNYDTFISVALLFDHIFTTDENMVERYRKDAGHDRVYVLPFAANGNVHTPIMSGMRNGRIAFAGSWHGRKYPIRAERLDMLFKHPHREGLLDIFDRHSSAPSVEDGLKYPDKYQDAVLPAVPYEKIADSVYKKYSVALNVNSVETSTSMLARRIYELCGCGTPILSSPARSLEGELREIVPVARSAQEAEQLTKRLLTDEVYSMRLAARGVRFVHSRNTYSHRAHKILKVALGTSSSDEHTRFSVTAICVSKRPWYAEAVARMLKSQENIDLSVVYVAHGVEANENEVTQAFQGFEKFKFLRIAEEDTVLADGLNAALEVCDTDIVAKIDDDDHYGPHYLYDSCLALRYSKADIVGKASFFFHVESTNDFGIRFPGKHYRYFKRVQGGTLVWNQHKTLGIQFTPVRQGTDSLFIRDILDRGGKVFSSDPFNFVHVRHSSANNHTWSIADNDFLRPTKILAKGLQLDLAFA